MRQEMHNSRITECHGGHSLQRLLPPMLTRPQSSRHLVAFVAWLALCAAVSAQNGPWHYLNKADAPPGVIGQRQLERGGPLPGYFQPVEVTAPAGSLISVVCDGAFSEPKPAKLLAGMLIGQV